ncbi:MAG: hypothetical protein M9958_12470 [Chitinophagales bacterium]|nr:hypothetical protein [Chitinophagales bacterium]
MTDEETKLDSAYKVTIAARNFHLDHFNKWMTYYYVAVAAIFVGFYNIKDENFTMKIGLLALGLFVSVLWHLSCKGYYFWVKNWTYQVLRLEKEIDDKIKVYSVFSKSVKEKDDKIFIPTQSANISTSKVTLFLSFIISLTWTYLLIDKLTSCFCICGFNIILNLVLSLVSTFALTLLLGVFFKTDIKNHLLN